MVCVQFRLYRIFSGNQNFIGCIKPLQYAVWRVPDCNHLRFVKFSSGFVWVAALPLSCRWLIVVMSRCIVEFFQIITIFRFCKMFFWVWTSRRWSIVLQVLNWGLRQDVWSAIRSWEFTWINELMRITGHGIIWCGVLCKRNPNRAISSNFEKYGISEEATTVIHSSLLQKGSRHPQRNTAYHIKFKVWG